MSEEIIKILKAQGEILQTHTEQFRAQGKILDAHTEKLKVLDTHTEQLRAQGEILQTHTEQFRALNGQVELIATTVLGHSEDLQRLRYIEERIKELPTAKRLDEIIEKVDKLLKKATDVEQEGTMRSRTFRRITDQVDENTKDIKLIKPLVGLA